MNTATKQLATRQFTWAFAALWGVGIIFTPVAASAAGGRSQMRAEKHLAKLQERLDLSEEQTNQVREVFAAAKKEFNCRESENWEQRRECRRDRRAKVSSGIEAILDEKQRAEFAAVQAERKERFKQWRHKKGCDCK